MNEAEKGPVIFLDSGKLNMDATRPWPAARYLIPYLTKELGLAAGDLAIGTFLSSLGEICIYIEPGTTQQKTIALFNHFTGQIIIKDKAGDRELATGLEDLRTYEERLSDWFDTFDERRCLKKFEAGTQLGQHYVGNQPFNPTQRIISLGTKSFHETFLGLVGLSKGGSYEGHEPLSKKHFGALAAAQDSIELASIISKNWRELFSPSEAYRIYARRKNIEETF